MKLGFNTMRNALSGVLALVGISSAMFCSAQSTITLTSNVHTTSDTEWTDTLAVAPFNPTLGTLTGVTITLKWNTFVAITGTNTDVTPETIYATDQTSVLLGLPSGATLTGASPTITLGSLGVNSFGRSVPTYSVDSQMTVAATPITTASTSAVTLSDAASLAAFSGISNIVFPVNTATVVSEIEQGGNFDWAVTTQSGAWVTVTYTYNPTTNQIPPPTGPFTTFTQGGWHAPSNSVPGHTLDTYFPTACPTGITIGSTSGNYYLFTSAAAVRAFLPQGGGPKVLPAGHKTNPTGKGSVVYGQLLSVKLAVAFSTSGALRTGISNLKVQSGPFAGCTVALVTAIGDAMLGGTALPAGTPVGANLTSLNTCLDSINICFDDGTSNTGFIK